MNKSKETCPWPCSSKIWWIPNRCLVRTEFPLLCDPHPRLVTYHALLKKSVSSESSEHVIARSVESLDRGTRYILDHFAHPHTKYLINCDATPNYGFRENELGMRTVLFEINADAYTMWESSFCRKNEDWDMAPCSLVRWHQRSSRMCIHLVLQNGGSKALRNVGTAIHIDIHEDCNTNTFFLLYQLNITFLNWSTVAILISSEFPHIFLKIPLHLIYTLFESPRRMDCLNFAHETDSVVP